MNINDSPERQSHRQDSAGPLIPYRPYHGDDVSKKPLLVMAPLAVPTLPAARTTAAVVTGSKVKKRRALCRGCNRRRISDTKKTLCFQCAAASTAAAASLPQIHFESIPAHHLQIYSEFLYAYFQPKPAMFNESYLQRVFTLDVGSPMLSSAIETLGLAHLGTRHGDGRMLMASHSAYGRVLSALRAATAAGPGTRDRPTHREVLASILLISHYSEGIPPLHAAQENHLTHLLGGVQYVDAYGPGCLDLSNQFDEKLLSYLRFQSFLAGVAARKKVCWGKAEWRRVGEMKYWIALLVPLPGMLERADTFLAHRGDVLHQFVAICKELQSWRESVLAKLEEVLADCPEPVSPDDLEAFDMEIEEHCFLSITTLFPTYHRRFAHPGHVVHIPISHLLSLIASATILRILTSATQTSHLEHQFGHPSSTILKSMMFSAREICRSIYVCTLMRGPAASDWVCVLLEVLVNFYGEVGERARAELGWCQGCLIAARMRRERMRVTGAGRPTLCRVKDLAGPFVKGVRWGPGRWS